MEMQNHPKPSQKEPRRSKPQKRTSKLLAGNYPLLSFKELMDNLIMETRDLDLGSDILTLLADLRKLAWTKFSRKQEESIEKTQ